MRSVTANSFVIPDIKDADILITTTMCISRYINKILTCSLFNNNHDVTYQLRNNLVARDNKGTKPGKKLVVLILQVTEHFTLK